MREPTNLEVERFWSFMCNYYRTHIAKKEDLSSLASFMSNIGIMDEKSFMRNYATTIGRTIFIPFQPGVVTQGWSLWDQLVVCVHEHQHIVQYDDDSWGYMLNYVTSETYRTQYEVDAYATQLELLWMRGVELKPTHVKVLLELLNSYMLSDEAKRVAETQLVSIARSVNEGVVTRDSTEVARIWLTTYAPGVLVRGTKPT